MTNLTPLLPCSLADDRLMGLTECLESAFFEALNAIMLNQLPKTRGYIKLGRVSESCDCLTHCGDDPLIASGEVVPCEHYTLCLPEVVEGRWFSCCRFLAQCHAEGLSEGDAFERVREAGARLPDTLLKAMWLSMEYRLQCDE